MEALMIDVRAMILGKKDKTSKGKYYKKVGKTGEGGISIDYAYADMRQKAFRMLFDNIENSESRTVAISTPAIHPFKVGEYILLSDGSLYQIIAIAEDTSKVKSKQAFRHMANVAGVDAVIRLVEVDNPWRVT